jgi:hypothetical protein
MKRARKLAQKILVDVLVNSGYHDINEFEEDLASAIKEVEGISEITRTARGEEGISPNLEQNQMWQGWIEIQVGEYQHTENVYFFGIQGDALKYLESYLSTIWGTEFGETTWDEQDQAWYSKDRQRAARDIGVNPFNHITAATAKGTLIYTAGWKLK